MKDNRGETDNDNRPPHGLEVYSVTVDIARLATKLNISLSSYGDSRFCGDLGRFFRMLFVLSIGFYAAGVGVILEHTPDRRLHRVIRNLVFHDSAFVKNGDVVCSRQEVD